MAEISETKLQCYWQNMSFVERTGTFDETWTYLCTKKSLAVSQQ